MYDLRELCPQEAEEDFRAYWAAVERHCGRLGTSLTAFERGGSAAGSPARQYRRPEAAAVHFELEARPDLGLIRVGLDIECPRLYAALEPVLDAGRRRLVGILGTGARFRDNAGPGIVSEWLPFDRDDPECARATALRLACYVGALNPLLDHLFADGLRRR